VLFVTAFIALSRPVPYVRLSPGPVYNALGESQGQPVIEVDGAESFPTDGELGITTVFEIGAPGSQLTLGEAFTGWIDPAVDVIPRDLLFPPDAFDGDDAADRFEQQGALQMAQSEESAVAAALTYLDEPVTFEVVIDEVEPDTPADGALVPGDTVVAINDVPTGDYRDVKRVMSDVTPGDEVQVEVRRDSETVVESITTTKNPTDPERAYLGVLLGIGFSSPVDVTVRLDDVGGPSAGLVFALAIIDSMTPESLTGGRSVAGTGTITPSGKVGAIGGVVQKMYGARDEGATLFLAPHANCAEVAGNEPDGLQVVAVRTLEQAVDALDGEGPLPSC
jgi:PDZ domain-containing protein